MADVQEEMRSIPQGAVCHSKRERLQTVDTHVVVMVKQRLPDKFCTILAKKKKPHLIKNISDTKLEMALVNRWNPLIN